MQIELTKQEIQKILDLIDDYFIPELNYIPEDLKHIINKLSESLKNNDK